MATIKKELKEILDKYGIDPKDKSKLWDCHGTLVLYHKAYEVIAAKESIKFDPPQIIESNSKDKIVCVCVTGHMGDRKEWSFGEAAPGNCTNKYPYAMAEKRAKDRVIGKLVGLAQYVYSEDEAEEFKPNAASDAPKDTRKDKQLTRDFYYDLNKCKTIEEVNDVKNSWWDILNETPGKFDAEKDQIETRINGLKNNVTFPPVKYSFVDVQEAVDFATLAKKNIDEGPIDVLEDWMIENDDKIKALDKILTAAIYNKDGTPSERLFRACENRFSTKIAAE